MYLFTRLKLFSRSHRLQHSFLALVLAVLPLAAMGQSDSDAEEVNEELTEPTLEEVVVSASRVPVPAQHVGSSVTVFDQSDIENRQATHVHELLREAPGLAVSQYSLSGQTQLRIRGSEANHTLVLFDGIELSDPLSSDEFYLQHLPAFATGRIEVLRGAQSSLYGSEAIGGVINVTSPIPEEGTSARVRVSQGSFNTSKVNSYTAIASGENYGSLAVNYVKSKGVSARSDNTERDGLQQTNAHIKVGSQITDDLNISGTVLLLNLDADYDNCSFGSSNDCKGKDKKRAIGVEMNYEQLDGNLVHTVKLNTVRHERNETANGVPETPKLGEKSKIEYQASLNWDVGSTNQATIFAVNKEKNKAVGQYVAGGKGGKFDTKSFVLEQRADFGNDVFASLSARYDDNKASQFKNHKTYRGTLAWILNEGVRIHTSAGTGVKNPQVSELYGWSSNWDANPDLEPETSRSLDFGVEYQPAFADLTIDATYFVNKVTNLISSTCSVNCDDNDFFNNISKSINRTGVSTIKGWELALVGNIANNYEVTANATFLKGFDANGNELLRRPSQIISLNISSENTYFGKPASSNLNIQHVGKQLDLFPWPAVGVGDLPEYTLVNVGTNVELNSDLELTAKIDNLFDKKYTEIRGYNKPGRSISIGMQYTF